jgi:hypothetical protein
VTSGFVDARGAAPREAPGALVRGFVEARVAPYGCAPRVLAPGAAVSGFVDAPAERYGCAPRVAAPGAVFIGFVEDPEGA